MQSFLLLPICQIVSCSYFISTGLHLWLRNYVSCPQASCVMSASDACCCEICECSVTYCLLLHVPTTGMLLNGLSITNLICVFVLCSQEVENPRNFNLDDATSLLKFLWPYMPWLSRGQNRTLRQSWEDNADTQSLAMMCAHGGLGCMDDRNPLLILKFYINNLVRKATWKEYQHYF